MYRTTSKIFRDKEVNLTFDTERPYIKIIRVNSNYSIDELRRYEIIIDVNVIDNYNNTYTKKYELNFDFDSDTGLYKAHESNLELNTTTKSVLISFSSPKKDDISDIYFQFDYELIDRIKSESQHNLFKHHLSQTDNIKLMFSAPFGHGKSTFLEYFFKEENNYDVFKLTPVNYSIASNEDIFKYIKSDILTQLIGADLNLDSTKISHLESFSQFSKKNLDRMLIPFLLTIPIIGKSVYTVSKDLINLKDQYFEFHDANNETEKDKVQKYIEKLYENEGSIYEDNFFTQLIRQLLEVLKLKTERESVLIIDDLDRMDPEHIFRILNVLSVHFDSFNEGEININNKFGFDKIILVCDYENIRKIYEHKYGKNVDFGGYINKYFSKNIFKFDYVSEVDLIIESLIDKKVKFKESKAFTELTKVLFKSKLLSLRDLYKLKNEELTVAKQYLYDKKSYNKDYFYYGVFSPTIKIFTDILGFYIFKSKIESLSTEAVSKLDLDLEYYCLNMIGAYKAKSNKKEIDYVYKNNLYNIKFDYSPFDLTFEIISLHNKTSNVIIKNPKIGDAELFQKLIIENIEKYKELDL